MVRKNYQIGINDPWRCGTGTHKMASGFVSQTRMTYRCVRASGDCMGVQFWQKDLRSLFLRVRQMADIPLSIDAIRGLLLLFGRVRDTPSFILYCRAIYFPEEFRRGAKQVVRAYSKAQRYSTRQMETDVGLCNQERVASRRWSRCTRVRSLGLDHLQLTSECHRFRTHFLQMGLVLKSENHMS